MKFTHTNLTLSFSVIDFLTSSISGPKGLLFSDSQKWNERLANRIPEGSRRQMTDKVGRLRRRHFPDVLIGYAKNPQSPAPKMRSSMQQEGMDYFVESPVQPSIAPHCLFSACRFAGNAVVGELVGAISILRSSNREGKGKR